MGDKKRSGNIGGKASDYIQILLNTRTGVIDSDAKFHYAPSSSVGGVMDRHTDKLTKTL